MICIYIYFNLNKLEVKWEGGHILNTLKDIKILCFAGKKFVFPVFNRDFSKLLDFFLTYFGNLLDIFLIYV